jgi:hypothetical protein
MNPQERQVLQDFLNQLVQVRGIVKDPEAQTMIAGALAQQPDAPYLLVQRALLLDQALDNAKQEIAALQSQVRGSSQGSGSFLDANAWGNSGTMRPAYSAQPAAPAPQQYQMPAQQQAAAPGFLRGGMGGMLGTVAATAAGVAGGAFLFQGIEHLMGGQQGAGHGLLGQQNDTADTSLHNAFPSLTRPGEEHAGANHLTSDTSPDDPATGSESSSGLLDDVDNNYVDDIGGGDDSMLS